MCHRWNLGLNGPVASEEMSFESVDRRLQKTENCLSNKLPRTLCLCLAKNPDDLLTEMKEVGKSLVLLVRYKVRWCDAVPTSNIKYSRTSMARTPKARLQRLFWTLPWVPWKKSHSSRHYYIWDNLVWFSFSIDNGMLCVLNRIASRGDSNENTQHTFMLKKIEKIIPFMPPDLAL